MSPTHKICVVIPTYNNATTLKEVVQGCLKYCKEIIVVNDGSTDSTKEILANIPGINVIHQPVNQGKGMALRVGFRRALERGATHAITIDSDGQHFPDDIPAFQQALEESDTTNLLLIGARNMEQSSIPKKSSFGNKFSNFWYTVETGITLSDTQSGYRLYPLQAIKELKLYTNKFEYEIEIIVKAAWSGTRVKNIPVQIHYATENRVTHFRPFKDFTRISILNTFLVIKALFYIKPRDLLRRVRSIGLWQFIKDDILGSNDSPKKKALSICLGTAIGLSPFWGFHSVIVISLAILLKLNKAIAFAFSNISLPPFIPFVVYCSATVGNFVLGRNISYQYADIKENFEPLQHLQAYLLGSLTLAVGSALVIGILAYLTFTAVDNYKSTKIG